jgi:DNA transformation protein
MRDDLLKLKNIGEKSVDWLIAAGIESPDDLEQLGAAEAFRRIQEQFPVNRTMLWALQGALMDLPYNRLPDDVKQSVLQELE